MVTMLVIAGSSDVLVRDEVRCHATPTSSSEPMRNSRDVEQASKEDSLSSPSLSGKTVPGGKWKLETLCKFCLNEDGRALVSLVRILLVDSSVVLLRVIAAFHDTGHQLSQLAHCVARVMNVSLRLEQVSMCSDRMRGVTHPIALLQHEAG